MSVSSITLEVPQLGQAGAVLSNIEGPATEVQLSTGDLWRMRGHSRWRVVVCLRGVVWVTQEHDPRDYVLTEGEMFLVTQPGTVLVGAVEDARVQVTRPVRTAPYRGSLTSFP